MINGVPGSDATTLLRRDHEAVRELIRQFGETARGPQRRLLFQALKSELRAHSRMEEEIFYPVVMKVRSSEARISVREALEEHQVIDGLLAEIDQMDPEDPRYEGKVAALRESIERHIDCEEGRMFAQVRIHLTDERLEALGLEMAQSRRERTPSAVPP